MVLGEPLSFFLFEVMVLFLLVVCLYFGVRKKRLPATSVVLELTVFIIYGLSLESIAVAAGFYEYAPFTVEVWLVPLVIGVGWGVIGFSAMWFSDSLNMPQWSKPFLDALLALLIDLGMDTVAIRDSYPFDGQNMGMWSWGLELDAQWFGVPYGNFLTWWVVVFIMSNSLRGGRYLALWFEKRWLTWIYPVIALTVALPVFLLLLLTFAGAFDYRTLLLLVGVSIAICFVNVQGIQERLTWLRDAPVFLVPLAFHLFFLTLMLWRRLHLDSPGILLSALFAFALHHLILFVAGRRAHRVLSEIEAA
ncbi:MAG: carotenoid biosynthesis protein [Trueperaceae bacterium]|nr:MAG: carotenoid biosynthesis protein [Trueperaceae bacterium]